MKATTREWIGLAVLGLPTLLISIDVGVLYLALPSITESLGANTIEQLWILDVYSFLLAGFLLTMGNVGDRIGRRRLLLIGSAAFAVASLWAAFASTPGELIAARAGLGVAAATLAPSTMALLRNMFHDPQQLATAIGVWFACFMGGVVVGPLIGGMLLEWLWWGSVFLLAVPVMVVLLILGPLLLPEYRVPHPGPIDGASVALSLATVLPVVWAVKEVARDGSVTWTPLVAAMVGLVAGAVFVRRQRNLATPLLDLSMFRTRVFSGSLVIVLVTGVAMAGLSLVAAVYLQSVLGLSPLAAGALLIPQSVAMLAGFQIAPALSRRLPLIAVAVIGLSLASAGFLVVAVLPVMPGSGVLVVGLCVASFGASFPMAVLSAVMLGSVEPARAGAAAAVNEASGELGVAMGVALLGSLAAGVYAVTLAALQPEASSLALASLESAVRGEDAVVASAAREAYTVAVSAVGLAGAVIFTALAGAAGPLLRRGTAPEGAAEDADAAHHA
ncbi:MFS transporter [Microbacterium sp. dk485]|uniref:MFS transporter n=1 Tax=Microbacterium sp. dk485 TaxID=2560021 RepID=UPI001072F250|nr:MFS transporter [Microbacterium sp. dk485]TFV84344.1 MFS transporter [Microbacterium sp. dk485]